MQNIPLDSEAFGAVWRRVNMQSYEKSFSDTEFLQQVINSTFQKAKMYIQAAYIFHFSYLLRNFSLEEKSLLSKLQGEYFLITGDTFPLKHQILSQSPASISLLRELYQKERSDSSLYVSAAEKTGNARLSKLCKNAAVICNRHADGTADMITSLIR